ncbi:MAG TPA: hypothetical protein VGO50_18755 [Pyrinomonadaceae bacterium]|jgi:hypothetical protein|nr:hypothetical protein [Pyrinomonadaceae bacterium]
MIRRILKLRLPGTLSLIAFAALSINAQADRAKKQEAYQNQQRAANLSILRPNIKLVDDAPQRCLLRVLILQFIFEKKISDHYEAANALALECLDETVANKDQFSQMLFQTQKNHILSLLRKYSPELAVKAEKKYFTDQPDSLIFADWELDIGGNPDKVADRAISKMAGGDKPSSIVSLVDKLDAVNKRAKFRVLSAALDYYEANIETVYEETDLIFLSPHYLDPETPVQLRKRFHNFVARFGMAALTQPENENLTRLAVELLKNALPDIKQISPELYPRAFSIFNALSSKSSEYEREKDGAMERINAAKDKLAQTISEAESAENPELKDTLWLQASVLALEEKKFRVAADSRMRMRELSSLYADARDFFYVQDLLDPCLKENDIETAGYIVKLVKSAEFQVKGLFKIAARLVELKRRETAFDTLDEGWKALEKAENKTSKIWTMQLAIPIALTIDKTRAFDMASDIVKTVNRFPTPGPDDKPGTKARQKYADTLTGVSYNLDLIFRLLGKENMALADPISQGIQLRELRLAAQIALETERKYPLPEEPSASSPAKP